MPPSLYQSTLVSSLAAAGSETTVFVSSLKTMTDETITWGEFSPFTRGIIVVDPESQYGTQPEIISFTGVDSVNLAFTGCIRGLSAISSSVIAANKTYHGVNTPVIISWGAQNITDLITYINTLISGTNGNASDTVAGITFLTSPGGMAARPRSLSSLVYQGASPSLVLNVVPFHLSDQGFDVDYAGGTITMPATPVSNPRIDLVVYNANSATLTYRQGTEGISPSAPTPTQYDIVLAQTYRRVGDTKIFDTDQTTNGYINRWYYPSVYNPNIIPTGVVSPFAGRAAPTGWSLCDGSAISRTTFASLMAVICPSQTATITIASPGIVTATAHGLITGDKIHFTTTGALPTGLATNTDYWISKKDANSFWVFDTKAHAFADNGTGSGTGIVNTTGSQSGTHTVYNSTYGKGDGSTTFNLPDYRGLSIYGQKTSDANFDTLNNPNTYVGEKTHIILTAEMPSHRHDFITPSGSGGVAAIAIGTGSGTVLNTSNYIQPTGSDAAHNNMPPYSVSIFIIKT